MSSVESGQRVLSGMRPTGRLHLGHYHGVLKNWLELQHTHDCFFMVADWHALTTHFESPYDIEQNIWAMIIDWLAAGINPGSASLFVQSNVPEQAELHVLLSMITPQGWLERMPSFKEHLDASGELDGTSFGFLGYPLLQSADILAYRAGLVSVGADQIAHIELTRDIARRFNHLYGKDPGFELQAEAAIKKLGKKNAKLYRSLLKRYQEQGDDEALDTARALIKEQHNISLGDRERLFGYIEGGGKVILAEPSPVLSDDARLPGLDGHKMSKTAGNAIGLRDEPEQISTKIRIMQTDPKRVRLTDAGNPEDCPVWPLHQRYCSEDTRSWVRSGCQAASIGCIDCKNALAEAIIEEHAPIRERAVQYEEDPELVKRIISEGTERARDIAKSTLDEVKTSMGLSFGR